MWTQTAEFSGLQILARGNFVLTVGRNEGPRLHQNQEAADKQLDRLQLKLASVLIKSHLPSQNPL
jgi:hypothetical protein